MKEEPSTACRRPGTWSSRRRCCSGAVAACRRHGRVPVVRAWRVRGVAASGPDRRRFRRRDGRHGPYVFRLSDRARAAHRAGRRRVTRIIIDVPRKDARWLRVSSVFTLTRGLRGNTALKAFSGILSDPPLPDSAERKCWWAMRPPRFRAWWPTCASCQQPESAHCAGFVALREPRQRARPHRKTEGPARRARRSLAATPMQRS